MKLTKPQVKHISDLARLSLSNEEVAKFQKQLSSILEYVELLNEVDTEGTEVTAQTTGLKNVYRDDQPSEEQILTPEEVLANAAETEGGYIKTRSQIIPKKSN